MEEEFDISKDFWKLHPQFKNLDGFRQFYASNKGQDSSKFMWFLKYVYHPDSVVSGMRESDRIEYIEKSILEDIGFVLEHTEEIEELGDLYKSVIDTPLDRIIRTVQTKLEQKETFLKDATYDLQTFEDLDKAINSLEKQYAILEKLVEKKNREKESSKRGKEEMSESDRGTI